MARLEFARLLCLALAVGWCGLAASQARTSSSVAHLASGKPLNESRRSESPVGGHDLVGLTLTGEARGAGALDLYVRVPTGWPGGAVCLEVVSRDGAYVAADVFTFPPTPPGNFVKLDFHTDFADVYRNGSRSTLAINARPGQCNGFGSEFFPVAWPMPSASGPQAAPSLSILTGRRRALVSVNGGEATACEPIEDQSATAFDATCAVQLPASGKTTFKVERCVSDDTSCRWGKTFTVLM